MTSLTTGETVRIPRLRGVRFQYEPAVTPAGTVFFERNKPCVRRCPKLNTPAMVAQLVEQPLGRRPRVLVTLRKGQDGGYMYAAQQKGRVKVVYSRFRHLPHGYISFSDIFALTVSSSAQSRWRWPGRVLFHRWSGAISVGVSGRTTWALVCRLPRVGRGRAPAG